MDINVIDLMSGDDVLLQVEIYDENENPVNLLDYRIKFTVRDKEDHLIIEKVSDFFDQINVDPANPNIANIYIYQYETENLEGVYKYDIELYDITYDTTYTAIKSFFIVKSDITIFSGLKPL